MSVTYIIISIIVVAIIALLVFLVNKDKKKEKASRLVGLSFAFILAGILFGEDMLIGYLLLGVGVTLAVIDIIKRLRIKK